MDELGLPPRLFETGFEPSGRKRVNSYFNLCWLDLIKQALEDEHLGMLTTSQFGRVLQMGGHIFSVMFMHYLLSRQLVTEKELELWWLRKGASKGKASTAIWDELFRGEEKPTISWIMERLIKGKRYKDPLTRLRLSLLVLVDGILCPTCDITKIRTEVVSMLGNVEDFLKYPWGRELFLLTVRSAKAKPPINYVQETMAIQGFSHAMVLVVVSACPSIIVKAGGGDPLVDSSLASSEIVRRVVERRLAVNPVTAKSVDELGQERLTPMFEGYILSLKGYFNTEVGSIRTDVQAATTSVRDLENLVTTEFESMHQELK
ncbi:hypothetical protein N665_0026s0036, partial [Sinapis alba]